MRAPSGPGSLLLVTDDDAVEFRLVSCPVPDPDGQAHEVRTGWAEVRPEDPTERLERVDAFAGYVVASLRRGGAHVLRVLPTDDLSGAGVEVVSRFAAGGVHLARNTWYDADVGRCHRRVVDRASGPRGRVVRRRHGHRPSPPRGARPRPGGVPQRDPDLSRT